VKRFADVLQQTPIEQETAPATGPIRARTLGDRGHSDCAKYGWPIPDCVHQMTVTAAPLDTVALKVRPDIQNVPVAERKKWATRTREQVHDDLQKALGIVTAA